MSSWKWFVYIIECKDGTYYTGITWNIDERSLQHASGFGSAYTHRHGFKRLCYTEEYSNIVEARKRERQLKDWSQKKKKLLINGELFKRK